MDFEFVAGFGPIGTDPAATHTFWARTMGIEVEEAEADPGYFHTFHLPGTKAFGLWPLEQAAAATFGTQEWPADRPVPQAWIEFEVSSPEAVAEMTERLRESGQEILLDAHQEPWGQTTSRLQSPEGLLVGVSYLPAFHESDDDAVPTGAVD